MWRPVTSASLGIAMMRVRSAEVDSPPPSSPPPPEVSEFSAPGVFSSESIQSAAAFDESGILETPLEASPEVTVWITVPPASLRYRVSPALFRRKVPTSFSAMMAYEPAVKT